MMVLFNLRYMQSSILDQLKLSTNNACLFRKNPVLMKLEIFD